MRLLFITRKYPPAVGGMENYSYALASEFEKKVYTRKITWGHSQKWLPYFIPKAFFQALYVIYSDNITHIHFGDGLLSPLALILKIITRKKVSTTICGLDITYKNKLYQFVVPKCVKQLDKIICISTATMQECIKRGIPKAKCTMIPIGIYTSNFILDADRSDLNKVTGKNLTDNKVLVTVGRLVKRKGVLWFVEEVLPKLGNNYTYLIVGDGPEKEKITQAIKKLHLENKALLLGKLPDKEVKIIYNTADAFIMPNIPVEGDIEGFGIVAIEASSAGLPVIASDLEGIKDAVIQNRSGKLINTENVSQYIEAIKGINEFDKNQIIKNISEKYSWSTITNNYVSNIQN